MRLDKFLSHTGFGSRKEVKYLLKKSQVKVNGATIKDGKYQVSETVDQVDVHGQRIQYQALYYYMLHKPQGVISATEDRVHRTVLDLLSEREYRGDLFPVGRLDKDTTGLLVITNDGELSHNLLSPKKHVAKSYVAEISGVVTVADCQKFAEGLTISGGELCQPAELEIISVDSQRGHSVIRVTIKEGKYHQVKRMFEAVGKQVVTLHRESMGGLSLDLSLAPGEYRQLKDCELESLGLPVEKPSR